MPYTVCIGHFRIFVSPLAEAEGFEPPIPLSMLVFKTSAFDHSATPPPQR